MALVLILLAEWSALASLPPDARFAALLLAPALARWTVIPVGLAFRPARTTGLGHAIHRGQWPLAAPLATAIAFAVALVTFGLPGLALVAIGALAALLLAASAARLLEGVTGDVYGAAIEGARVAVWLGAVAAVSRGWAEPLFGQ